MLSDHHAETIISTDLVKRMQFNLDLPGVSNKLSAANQPERAPHNKDDDGLT
jgi:hypothetical protein